MKTNQTDTDLEDVFQTALQNRRLQEARQTYELERQKLEAEAGEDATAAKVDYLLNAANRSLRQAMNGSRSVNDVVRKIQTSPLELFRCGLAEPVVMSLQIRRLNPADFADSFAMDLYEGCYTAAKYLLARPYRTGLYSLGRTPKEMQDYLKKICDPVELTKELARFA